MSQNYVRAFVLAVGVASAGSAVAQPNPYQPGSAAARVQAQMAARQAASAPAEGAPAQAVAAIPRAQSWLHPQYEEALILEAAKRKGSFDPARQCATQAQTAAGPLPPNYVQDQVAGIIKGKIKEQAYSGSTWRGIAGQHVLGEQQIAQQYQQGQARACSMIIEHNKWALNGNLGGALQMVYNDVGNAQANGMVAGRASVQDAMRDRNNANTQDAAAGAILPGYGQPGGLTGQALCRLTRNCK